MRGRANKCINEFLCPSALRPYLKGKDTAATRFEDERIDTGRVENIRCALYKSFANNERMCINLDKNGVGGNIRPSACVNHGATLNKPNLPRWPAVRNELERHRMSLPTNSAGSEERCGPSCENRCRAFTIGLDGSHSVGRPRNIVGGIGKKKIVSIIVLARTSMKRAQNSLWFGEVTFSQTALACHKGFLLTVKCVN